ncbi:MAG TPA: hypothetical protein VF765_07010 [Polyangiaceae bacterium]
MRLATAAVLAAIALICPRLALADEPAAFETVTATHAAVADHLRLTGFAVGELPIDLGVARAPRLYIWDPVCWERALPVTNMGVASALVVLNYDW